MKKVKKMSKILSTSKGNDWRVTRIFENFKISEVERKDGTI